MENNKRRGSEERIVLAHPTMVYDKDRRFNHPGTPTQQKHTMILFSKGGGPEGPLATGHSHQQEILVFGNESAPPLKMPVLGAY